MIKYAFMVLLAVAIYGAVTHAINLAVSDATEKLKRWQAPPVYFERNFYDI